MAIGCEVHQAVKFQLPHQIKTDSYVCLYLIGPHERLTHKLKIQSATYIQVAAALTAGTAGTQLLGMLSGNELVITNSV